MTCTDIQRQLKAAEVIFVFQHPAISYHFQVSCVCHGFKHIKYTIFLLCYISSNRKLWGNLIPRPLCTLMLQ